MKQFILDFIKHNPDLFNVILIILVTLLLIFLVHRLVKLIIRAQKKKTTAKKLVKLEQPLLIIIIIMSVQAVFGTYLRNYSRIHTDLNNLLISISIIIITYILSLLSIFLLEDWSKKLKKERNDETHEGIVPLMKSVIVILLIMLALIFILQVWGVSVGALLTSLGIAGVILGFAFKDTLTNVFAGIALILDDTFRKGDLIELSDGEVGFVIETSLRSTRLKNFKAEEVFFPNSLLANMKVKNYSQPTKDLRVKIMMPVAIGTNVSKVKKLILDLLYDHGDILDYPPPQFLFVQVKEYYLELIIYFYIKDFHDLYDIRSNVTTEIYETLLRNKIEIPVPARKIYQDKDFVFLNYEEKKKSKSNEKKQ